MYTWCCTQKYFIKKNDSLAKSHEHCYSQSSIKSDTYITIQKYHNGQSLMLFSWPGSVREPPSLFRKVWDNQFLDPLKTFGLRKPTFKGSYSQSALEISKKSFRRMTTQKWGFFGLRGFWGIKKFFEAFKTTKIIFSKNLNSVIFWILLGVVSTLAKSDLLRKNL